MAPPAVRDLVARFGRNLEDYRSGRYNETQVRREFIDPFFKCLGWDIDNEQGFAEAYKDVIHEDAIKVGGATKAPDYCFRVGGTRKFFLEAKKPSVYIKGDPGAAYQLRRYAWSAKLPLSVLTDFEEFAVYDCRVKPALNDKSSAARTQYLTYDEYESKWDDIAGVFSRDAVLKGSFDKYADTAKGKRGTATVDKAFLETLGGWRVMLAQNLALRNPKLTQRELNYAVQVTLDRIIFLRMCEDRGIEVYGRLLGLVNGPKIFARLQQVFREADDKYNSGLFYFTKEKGRADSVDALTPRLAMDDKVLKEIIKALYYPDCPYEFSVLPAEILGQVYEQFLGQVIRLTAGHQAKVEDKPEVKKAGGVYYTPTYIVDYIVKHTVGKLLGTAGHTPKDAAKLRVLDPACGSGSFLLGAYQYLLDWHRDWYVADGPANHPKALYQGPAGSWRLTVAERKRILLNNIYGVDIDPQAVEVTKLSLLLKVLEGESQDSLERQRRMFHERALPDLADNIKCGNSLIGPDFYDGQQLTLFDDEERQRINVFDWDAAFPKVMKAGGFDAVIGNPPYVRMEELSSFKDYLKRFVTFSPRADLYTYFLERAVSVLRSGARIGMIVSNKWMKAKYGGPLRSFLAVNAHIERIIDFGELAVFQTASTFPCVLLASRSVDAKGSSVISFEYAAVKDLDSGARAGAYDNLVHVVSEGPSHGDESWRLSEPSFLTHLLANPDSTVPLKEWLGDKLIGWGIKTGCNDAFIVDYRTAQKWLTMDRSLSQVVRPILTGDEIRRYSTAKPRSYVIYAGRGFELQRYPIIQRHLEAHRETLSRRATVGTHPWYELQQPQPTYAQMFAHEKVTWPEIAKEPRFTLVGAGIYLNNKCFFSNSDSRLLLGILNSSLAWALLKLMCSCLGDVNKGGRLELRQQYLVRFPMPVNMSQLQEVAVEKLVNEQLALHQRLAAAKSPPDRAALENQIAATDRQIDRLVYELYGLTEDEIKIVEEAT
jgi:type I restriction-modification system DNA methylase subunit